MFVGYDLIKRIGRGGFAKVYLARDVDSKKKVAIKTQPEHLDYEARIVKKLQPSGIVPLFVMFGVVNDREYIVTEALHENLQEFGKRVDLPSNVEIFYSLAYKTMQAVQTLHSYALLHRDLKPANIMLTTDGEVKLIDFGLAKKFVDDSGKHIENETKKRILGTMKYCSRFTHAGRQQSRRDDVESLVYTLLNIYNGCLPWTKAVAELKNDKKQQNKQLLSMKKSFLQGVMREEDTADYPVPSIIATMILMMVALKFEDEPTYSVVYDHIKKEWPKLMRTRNFTQLCKRL